MNCTLDENETVLYIQSFVILKCPLRQVLLLLTLLKFKRALQDLNFKTS